MVCFSAYHRQSIVNLRQKPIKKSHQYLLSHIAQIIYSPRKLLHSPSQELPGALSRIFFFTSQPTTWRIRGPLSATRQYLFTTTVYSSKKTNIYGNSCVMDKGKNVTTEVITAPCDFQMQMLDYPRLPGTGVTVSLDPRHIMRRTRQYSILT